MRVYITDSNQHHLQTAVSGWHYRRINLLLSYFYYKDVNLDEFLAPFYAHCDELRILADSGAFSAFTLKKPIDIGAYADWLHKWSHHIDDYANLDVKGGDYEQGAANLRYLQSRDLQPFPVFHFGEPWRLLEEMIPDHPYIGIGFAFEGHSLVDYNRGFRNFVKAFEMAGDTTVYHGFANVYMPYILRFPYFSVDSSSWGTGHRFGVIPVWDDKRKRVGRVRLGSAEDVDRYATELLRHNVDPSRLINRSATYQELLPIAFYAYMQLDAYMERLHPEEGGNRIVDASKKKGIDLQNPATVDKIEAENTAATSDAGRARLDDTPLAR